MTTEFRRAGVRIAANYFRLLATVCFGLVMVRLLLHTVGSEALSLVFLIGSTVGLAVMLEDIVSWGLIRHLGASHHSRDRGQFLNMYHSAVAVCMGASMATLLAFAAILAVLPLLNISESLLEAARWLVVARAIESAVMVLLAPQINMYLVLERMVAFNVLLIARRAALAAAAAALLWIEPANAAQGLIWYAWIASGIQLLSVVVAAAAIVASNRALIPSVRHATRAGILSILGMSGWNLTVLTTQILFGLPASQIIMNLAFGPVGNLIFGFASQLGGYTRMVTNGMTGGLEAVSARLSSTAPVSSSATMQKLLYHSSRLQAIAAFPTAIGISLLAEQFLRLWVGARFEIDEPESFASTVILIRIMVVAFTVFCFSDSWTKILFGAGYIARYAPLVIVGGLMHICVSGLLLATLPEPIRFTAVAASFAAMYLTIYLGLLPRVVARTFEVRYVDVFLPLVRPFLTAVAASPVLLAFLGSVRSWSVWWLLAAVVSYGSVYMAISWVFVLSGYDRTRLVTAARVRFKPQKTM